MIVKKRQTKHENGRLRQEKAAAWYQHEEVGYNYRMSNVIAGSHSWTVCHYLEEHIAQKKVDI